jgi:hypothetical protein
MPKKMNIAKRVAVENKNKKALAGAMNGTEAIFGKVEKALGNCGFQIKIQDPTSKAPRAKTVQGLIRGSFKGGSKSEAFLAVGMFVILSPAQERAEVHEIIAVVNKKKDLKALMDEELLPECLLEGERGVGDDLFDYTGVEEEDDGLTKEERKGRERVLTALAGGGGAKSAVVFEAPAGVGSDDIDIDAL